MSEKYQHLTLIQSVINRMSTHSFALKAIAVTVTSGTVALSISNGGLTGALLAIISLQIILLMHLDAKYLKTERMYVELYKYVSQESETGTYSLDASEYANKVQPSLNLVFSWSILPFYGFLLISIFIITLIDNKQC